MSDRQAKKAQFVEKKKRSLLPCIVIALAVVAGAGIVGWKTAGDDGKYPLVSAVQGQVVIPVSQVDDGQAHFFHYKSDAGTIDFFVLKSHDGILRTAFDTCDVCYRERKGYRQEGDFMVCNNCNQKFRSDLINEIKGGCNPAPLNRTIADGKLVIAAADLQKGAWYFSGAGK